MTVTEHTNKVPAIISVKKDLFRGEEGNDHGTESDAARVDHNHYSILSVALIVVSVGEVDFINAEQDLVLDY